jgi:hypothetical protein
MGIVPVVEAFGPADQRVANRDDRLLIAVDLKDRLDHLRQQRAVVGHLEAYLGDTRTPAELALGPRRRTG